MIRFVEEGHRYFDGEREIPCVSRIMQETGVSSPFYQNKEWHARKGTYVHKAVQLFNAGNLDLATVDETIRPYVEAWKSFLDMERIRIVASEKIVYHVGLDYCGRLDMIVEWERMSRVPIVMDLKSGSRSKEHAVQIAAYNLAEFSDSRHGAVVYLKPTGKFALEILNPMDMDVWTDKWQRIVAEYREQEARLWVS